MPKFKKGICRAHLRITLNGEHWRDGFLCELKKGHEGQHSHSLKDREPRPKRLEKLDLIEWKSEIFR